MGGLDLRFTIIERHRPPGDQWGYNTVRIKVQKNAFGVDGKYFDVRFSWTWMDADAGRIQVPKWEWNLATATFLAGYDRADIKDICHVVQGGSKPQPLFNCRQLGLREVTGHDFGIALRQDKAVYDALQKYLKISRWTKFDSNMAVPEE